MHKTLVTMLATALLIATSVVQAQPAPATSTAMPAATAAAPNVGTGPQPAATHKPPVVMHAQFTTAVNNRAPADDVSTLDNSHDQVFFFTELKDAEDQTIIHRWEFNGKTVAEVSLQPKAAHWRTWSSKKLLPEQTGTWTVEVVDDSGKVLMSKTFDYTQAPKSEPNASNMPAMQNAPTPAAPASTKAATPPTL